jgi:hypothetical protein
VIAGSCSKSALLTAAAGKAAGQAGVETVHSSRMIAGEELTYFVKAVASTINVLESGLGPACILFASELSSSKS